MKLSYSTRWLICWGLVIGGILSVVSGVFTLPANAQIGSGLILIGAGLAIPAIWWLSQSRRGKRAPGTRPATSVGAVAAAAGLLILPWGNVTPVDDAEGAVQGRTEGDSTTLSRARTTPSTPPSPSSADPSETPTSDHVTPNVDSDLSEEKSTSAESEPTASVKTEATVPPVDSTAFETDQRQPSVPVQPPLRTSPQQSVEPTLPLSPHSPSQITPQPSPQTPVPSSPEQSPQTPMPSTSPVETSAPQQPSTTSTEAAPENDEADRHEEEGNSDPGRNVQVPPFIPPHISWPW